MSKKNQKTGLDEANGTTPADTTPAPASLEGTGAEKLGAPYIEALPCKLDYERLTALHTELTAATVARVLKEGQAALLREEIKALKETEAKVVGKLERGAEDGQVEVQRYLLPTREVQIVRTDTGEVIERRAADGEELQDELEFDDVPGTEHHDTPGDEEAAERSEDRP